jgi:DNA repair photolyase
MSIIYEPAGKAREYCDLAANLYAGCSHGCSYCYAPAALRRKPEAFHQAAARKDVIRQIEKEAPAYAGREVHLCFTCDPYQPIEAEHRLTRQTLDLFTRHQVRARVLTKGGSRCLQDLPQLRANGAAVGATLTFLSPADSARWEPGAATPGDRLLALAELKRHGIETWASLEPVIDPVQTLAIIRRYHRFIDTFKVGKWNHAADAKAIDWEKFAREAVALLDSLGARYYIKDDLRQYLPAAA